MALKQEPLNQTSNEVIDKLYKSATTHPASIAGQARKSIFEFPAFISSSVDYKYAEATCNLLELTYASYLQMAISQSPMVDESDVSDPFAQWKTDTNNYLECSNLKDSFDACHNVITEDGVTYEFNLTNIPDRVASVINEAVEYEPLSEFDHYFQEAVGDPNLEDLVKQKDQLDKLKDEIEKAAVNFMDVDWNDQQAVSERAQNDPAFAQYIQMNNIYANGYADFEAKRDQWLQLQGGYDKDGKRTPANDIDYQKAVADLKKSKVSDQEFALKAKQLADYDQDRLNQKTKFRHDIKLKTPELMDESKIQKLNSLKPLTMNVEMRVGMKDGSAGVMTMIAGVKIYSRLIDAETLPEVAEFPLKEMNKLTRNIRWKAGELKFFKDILFRIKEKKQTAIDSHDPKRKWYRRLYELAHTVNDSASVNTLTKGKTGLKDRIFGGISSKLSGGSLDPDIHSTNRGFIPNATIIVSKDDVNNVLSETGIDLLNNGKAYAFCRELFLMNFVVIDMDAQTIKVLTPDLHKDFEIHTLASVEKQLSMIDTASATSREIFKALKK
jgi:hypothetical protein